MRKRSGYSIGKSKANEARTAIQNEHSNNGVAQAKSNGIHEIELVTPDAHKNLMLNKVSMINIMSKVILSTLHQMQQMKKSKKH